jgi:RNA polymerase sigma-70 factor (ECF subfamily)
MNNLQFQKEILSIQDNMFSFALLLTSNRNDALDLIQETMLKALKNQDKYVDNINFKGWVMTIMRNIFINNYHKKANSQTIIDTTENLYHLNLPQTSGIEMPESSITVKEINHIINQLEKDLKAPFMMQLSGYKYDEIAEMLKLPLGTVKNRIFLARKKLQEKLKHMA